MEICYTDIFHISQPISAIKEIYYLAVAREGDQKLLIFAQTIPLIHQVPVDERNNVTEVFWYWTRVTRYYCLKRWWFILLKTHICRNLGNFSCAYGIQSIIISMPLGARSIVVCLVRSDSFIHSCTWVIFLAHAYLMHIFGVYFGDLFSYSGVLHPVE